MYYEQPQTPKPVYQTPPASVPPQSVAQPPVQPAGTFSSEPEMNITAGDERLTKVTVMLDQEALEIIQNASAVNSEAIVNLGIKLFAKTNVYKEFMVKAGNKPMDLKTEDIEKQVESVADVVAPTTTTPGSAGAPAAAVSNQTAGGGGGFTAW